MKKLLVILMVVAMASFLFVGCMPGVTPPVDDDEEDEEEPVVPTSATPVMTDVQTSASVKILTVTSTATQYMNKAEAGSSILVKGTGPSESLVQIYLDDVAIAGAVGETATTGLWIVAVAKSSLGADGAGKVLHATVTEVGLAESAASNSVTFTLDTVKPSATTLAATAETAAEDGDAELADDGTAVAAIVIVDADDVEDGTWVIKVLGITGALDNIKITDPDGDATTYTQVEGNQVFAANAPIPGVRFTLVAALSAGQQSEIECTAEVDEILGRARVLFSEKVTSASVVDIDNYTFTVLAVPVTPVADGTYHDKYAYFVNFIAAVDQYDTLNCEVNGAEDLAGNIQTTASYISCTVAEEDETSLAP